MTFRPYLLLTLLAFAAHGAGQAPSGAAPDPAPLVPPDYWQSSDWQGIPDSTRVDKQQVLFAKHDSDNYVGLVILLPDWQRSGQLWQLTRELGRLGFDTLLLLPSPQQTELDPAAEKKQQVIDDFRKQFASRISKLGDAKLQEGGFKLLLARCPSACPRVPLPMIPRRLPCRSVMGWSKKQNWPLCCQRPSSRDWRQANRLRDRASIRAMACSGTEGPE